MKEDDVISRQVVLDLMQMKMGGKELYKAVYELPSVTLKQRTGKCVWCSSPYRIEYYWIDREGHTTSFQDEDRHLVATGIAKYCPNCGRKMENEE